MEHGEPNAGDGAERSYDNREADRIVTDADDNGGSMRRFVLCGRHVVNVGDERVVATPDVRLELEVECTSEELKFDVSEAGDVSEQGARESRSYNGCGDTHDDNGPCEEDDSDAASGANRTGDKIRGDLDKDDCTCVVVVHPETLPETSPS